MNIIDAIKSGKRFRNTIRFEEFTGQPIATVLLRYNYETVEELILSDAWEVEEEKIEITRGKFNQAFESMMSAPGSASPWQAQLLLAKELGFKE